MPFTRYLLLLFIYILLFPTANAQSTQDLFMTKELRSAVENGSRTFEGKTGEKYWQNTANYIIKAELLPEERTIIGYESIDYSNNSPDTLKVLYFSIIQDLFKKGVQRDWDMGKVDLHEGVEITSIKIDGKSIDPNSRSVFHRSTLMGIRLHEYFTPNSKHQIEIEWRVILPGTITIRMGIYNKTNMMIAYWFPKIAVYDDIYGWAKIPHSGRAEYYHEFGDYNVELTLPYGYSAWSTGLLQNTEEIYNPKYVERIHQAAKSDSIIHIITQEDRDAGKIYKKADKFIWKFKAEYVPDFAFAISNTYLWDGISINTGTKRVAINAVYKSTSFDFHKVADVSRKSIEYYSFQSPKIEFPYAQLTVFNGDGGMEFPGMVNDGDSKNYTATLYVTAHEIGHSYFPFATGLNEQLYAWMDEGLITFMPSKIIAKYTDDTSYVAFKSNIKSYNKYAGSRFEIPLMVQSTNTGFAYRYQAYSRSAVAFYTLHEYLGEEKFDAALQEFYKLWKGKHPSPFDFFFTFNKIAGEDLAWFWKPWFFDLGYADLAIGKIDGSKVEIINKGGFPVPIKLTIKSSKEEITVQHKADIWKDGIKSIWIDIPEDGIISLKLDTELTADAFPEDNIMLFR